MRDPEFSAYIAPARLYPQLWRLILGFCLIIFAYVGFFAIMMLALYPIVGPIGYFGWVMGLQTPATPGHTLFLLISFVGMFLGPIIAVGACHFRSPGSLFGPFSDTLRCFGTALLVLLPIYAVFGVIGWLTSDPVSNMALKDWIYYLPLALPLLFVQVTAEELVFRGYLPQQLAVRFAAHWVWMGVPAVCFGLLHYNPMAEGNAWLIVGATFAFALIAMDLTEKTGNLGAAIGLHFINNIFALLVLSVKGTITGLALYVTSYDISDSQNLSIALLLDVLILVLIWRVLRFAVTR